MLTIKKKYIVDEQNHKIAVQLDIDTYKKIEDLLENYALVKLMEENKDGELLDQNEATRFYKKLDKAS